MNPRFPISRAMAGELLGTYLLVLFGTGSVASAVLTGAQVGLWQVAAVWGFGVTVAIYVSVGLSGAHLNPAVSLSMAVLRPADFPVRRLLPYVASQLSGAVLAGGTVALLFGPMLRRFEAARGIVRGTPGSELSAMVFGEYFPNPAFSAPTLRLAQSCPQVRQRWSKGSGLPSSCWLFLPSPPSAMRTSRVPT